MVSDTSHSREVRTQFEKQINFPLEGVPCCLGSNQDCSIVCVGLSSGRVAIFPTLPEPEFTPFVTKIHPNLSVPAHALCHIHDEWWLVAGPNHRFGWLKVPENTVDLSGTFDHAWTDYRALEAGADATIPTHLRKLDNDHVFVSHSRPTANSAGCSYIYRLEDVHTAQPKLTHAGSVELGRMRAVWRERGRQASGNSWILVGSDAKIWRLTRSLGDQGSDVYSRNELKVSWSGTMHGDVPRDTSWDPALVTDVALISEAAPEDKTSNRAVLNTDLGAFVIDVGSKGVSSHRLDHAGVRGIPLAVSSQTISGSSQPLVFCHDSLGRSHVYLAELATNVSGWNRILSSKPQAAPALRALALRPKDQPDRVAVWQIRRDESIGIATYVSGPVAADDKTSTPRTLAELRSWLDKNYKKPDLAGSLKGFVAPEILEPALPDRDPEALLAEYFDPASRHAQMLWDFLGDPSPKLAIEAVGRICALTASEDPSVRNERVCDAINLWAQTLVGSIHRHSPPFAADLALGILRWLHRLSAWAVRERDADEPEIPADVARTVVATVEDVLDDVRRWTWFAAHPSETDLSAGPTRTETDQPPYAFRIAAQVAEQREQRKRVDGADPRLEERLLKEALLFSRRVDDEAWIPNEDLGIPARDVARMELSDDRHLCAVLWRPSTIRFFVVGADGQVKRVPGELKVEEGARFGRALLMWGPNRKLSGGKEPYRLVTSVRSIEMVKDKPEWRERIALYELKGDPTKEDWRETQVKFDLESDRLMCLRQLTDTVIALGLRSESGITEMRLLNLGGTKTTAPKITLCPASWRSVPNPVQCIDFVWFSDEKYFRMAVGCDDGVIYDFELKLSELSNPPSTPRVLRRVAELAAPVWSVRCKQHARDCFRVYAGTSDGHIAAWEEVPSATGAPLDKTFACLWAIREADSIVGLWAIEHDLDLEGKSTPVVLAVSRNGFGVLFADQQVIESRKSSVQVERLDRPRVPGQRLERFRLRSSVFCVVSLRPPEEGAPRAPGMLGSVARLFFVTGRGVVRVAALHQPKRSANRRKAYDELSELWFDVLARPNATGGSRVIRRHYLRYAEALRGVAPGLQLLPISLLLLPRWPHREAMLEVPFFWYPRHLRPYLRCVHALGHVTRALTGKDRLSDGEFNRISSGFVHELGTALLFAYEHRDKALFKEIVENVTKRFNPVIRKVCEQQVGRDGKGDRDGQLLTVYNALLAKLEDACRAWLATDSEAYAHVQIIRIKGLVDGHALYMLATRRGERSDLSDLLLRRVSQVQELLQVGASLVPVETLRAVNFSLQRASYFLTDQDPVWPTTIRFVDAIARFSRQAAATSDDALAHEIARTFALCVLISPREAIRVAMGMRASRLRETIARAVEKEHELQKRLMAGTVTKAPQLTKYREAAFKVCREILSRPPTKQIIEDSGLSALERTPFVEEVEKEWRNWVAAFTPCNEVLQALELATGNLQQAPEKASLRRIVELHRTLTEVNAACAERKPHESEEERARKDTIARFEADRTFLLTQLELIKTICDDCGVPSSDYKQPSGASQNEDEEDQETSVRPAIVLASRRMHQWAEKALESLSSSPISNPQLYAYRTALEDFRDVTKTLRDSAAVQRRLVKGILGHHLMEALDDHVLRLIETAYVVNPRSRSDKAERSNGHGRSQPGPHGPFGEALTIQAERARAIPKNLRSLYQLLGRAAQKGGADVSVAAIFCEALERESPESRLNPEGKVESTKVSPSVAAALGLVFGELASNHRVHGDSKRRIDITLAPQTDRTRFEIKLPVPPLPKQEGDERKRIEEKRERFVQVAQTQMQFFLEPARDVDESSGVGLYLANLAASMVGWRLAIVQLRARSKAGRKGAVRKASGLQADDFICDENKVTFELMAVDP